MFCPNCGTQNSDTDKFCVKCGNALPSIQTQVVSPGRSQLAGMACHYSGCAEPVIGQCPGYKGACLRFYCAVHSVEPYCSVCAEKIARDIAIQAVYEDYLNAAKKVPSGIGCGGAIAMAFLFVLPCTVLTARIFAPPSGGENQVAIYTVMAIGAGIILFLMRNVNQTKQKKIAEISVEKPGFNEFYAEYEKQKKSESMATVLTGLLVAGAAANAIQTYQTRQDIHEIVKKMKS